MLNQTQGKNEDALQTDELNFLVTFRTNIDLTFLHNVSQCLSIIGILSNWFAKIPGLTSPVINDKG